MDVRASRSFAGPGEFPPSGFAGYGIVAFPDQPSSERGAMFCEAFGRAFLTVSALEARGVASGNQMVTVWPVEDPEAADALRAGVAGCDLAVEHYDLAEAQDALEDARHAVPRTIGFSALAGRGPYLLAWSPGEMKGLADTLVLVSDLSAVSSPEQAQVEFRRWRDEIQLRPELWSDGWSLEQLRVTIQRWSDQRGEAVLSVIGPL